MVILLALSLYCCQEGVDDDSLRILLAQTSHRAKVNALHALCMIWGLIAKLILHFLSWWRLYILRRNYFL